MELECHQPSDWNGNWNGGELWNAATEENEMHNENVINLNSRRPRDCWDLLIDAHENEANSRGATFLNFGWVTGAPLAITSKTSCGILTSYRSRSNNPVKHDWLTFG
jgi:hypothetical protein